MIEVQEGTVRISASTGAKRNEGNYQIQEAHAGISFEVSIPEGLSVEEALASASDLYVQMKATTNALVAAELGFTIDDDGGLVLGDVPEPAPARKAPARKAPARKRQASNGGGNRELSPIVTAFDGEQYYDNRPKKLAGDFKPNAADFRAVERGGRSYWVYDKDGSVNEEVVDLFNLSDEDLNELAQL